MAITSRTQHVGRKYPIQDGDEAWPKWPKNRQEGRMVEPVEQRWKDWLLPLPRFAYYHHPCQICSLLGLLPLKPWYYGSTFVALTWVGGDTPWEADNGLLDDGKDDYDDLIWYRRKHSSSTMGYEPAVVQSWRVGVVLMMIRMEREREVDSNSDTSTTLAILPEAR